jgi:hypothetical protein
MGRKAQGPEFARECGFAVRTCGPRRLRLGRSGRPSGAGFNAGVLRRREPPKFDPTSR